MKKLILLSILVTSSAFAVEWPVPPKEVDAWMKPILGKYSFAGDPGCKDVRVEDAGGDSHVTQYKVCSRDLLCVFTFAYGIDQASLSTAQFTSKSSGSSGVVGQKRYKAEVQLTKDADGRLVGVQMKKTTYKGFSDFIGSTVKIQCHTDASKN